MVRVEPSAATLSKSAGAPTALGIVAGSAVLGASAASSHSALVGSLIAVGALCLMLAISATLYLLFSSLEADDERLVVTKWGRTRTFARDEVDGIAVRRIRRAYVAPVPRVIIYGRHHGSLAVLDGRLWNEAELAGLAETIGLRLSAPDRLTPSARALDKEFPGSVPGLLLHGTRTAVILVCVIVIASVAASKLF